MKRRMFLQTLVSAMIAGTASLSNFWTSSLLARVGNVITSLVGKRVDNAQPVPPFTIENFKDTPSVRFLIIGDWGAGSRLQHRIAEQMQKKAEQEKCNFVMSTGDNIYPDGVISANDPQWKTKFEKVYTGEALDIPWYAVLGNHDYKNNPQAQVDYSTLNPQWNMPDRYYSFSKEIDAHTAVDFFALDTQRIMNGEARKEQVQWLQQALQRSTARWKIVFGHHMVRSHGAYGDQRVMIQHIKPLLDTYKVDMYICGHDHDLQYLKAHDDTFYCLVSGAGGGARDTAYGKNTLFAATNGGVAYMAISANKLHTQCIDSKGTVLFAHTLTKKL